MNTTVSQKGLKIPPMNLPWVDSPFFEELLEQSSLDEETKNQVKHYADYGYLILDPEIEDFDNLAEEIILSLSREYKRRKATRIQDAWKFNNAVKRIAVSPKVLSLLKVLYQREPIPFQTLNFLEGTQQKTHTDTIHFHSVPHRFMCGVWVALEDVDAYNGPLHYYPGSHKEPIYDFHDIGLSGHKGGYEYYPYYEDLLAAIIQVKGYEKVEVSLSKGQAIIWAANLMHGGSPILDFSRTRHSQVTHYFFSDCMYYTPLLSDPFIKKIDMRQIVDIRTGEWVPNVYNGEKIEDTGAINIEKNGKNIHEEDQEVNLQKNLLYLMKSYVKSSPIAPFIVKPVRYAKRLFSRQR